MLISVAHVAKKGHTDAEGLGHHLCPCWCPWAHATTRVMQILVVCAAPQSHGVVQAWAAVGPVWFYDSTATRIYFNICSSCYHWRPSRCQEMGYHLRPCWYLRVMVLLEPSWSVWVTYSATNDHGHIWTWAAIKGHVWVHSISVWPILSPGAIRMMPIKIWVQDEPALYFAGSETFGPAL